MIYSLQKKFIKIAAIALSAVMLIIFSLILIFSFIQLNSEMDRLADRISLGGGRFLFKADDERDERVVKDDGRRLPDAAHEEEKFSTRYFSLEYDADGNIVTANMDFISTVSRSDASKYGENVLQKSEDKGWISSFRYKVRETETGKIIVFVDGSMNISMSARTVFTVCAVILCSFAVVFLLIIFFSKRAVKPIAESYDKQKQFITDANHELKTPLTLILANIDIIESEIGKNEWLDDIRSESEQMSALVNQLVTLTRMDEGNRNMMSEQFDLSKTVHDISTDFQTLAEQKNRKLSAQIEPNISYSGDVEAIGRLISILLDNAVKYCDENGEITVKLSGGKHITLCVENTYGDVNNTELDRLFDRFYRSDKSRTDSGSFGIGLSIAKAIVQNHKGKITAYKADDTHIGFRVILKHNGK